MMVRRSQLAAVTLALAATITGPIVVVGAPPAEREPRPTSSSKKTLHLRLRGDLDCTKLVHDVAAELGRARSEGVEFVLVELDGNRWRADVVWGIAQEIRALRVPVAAWLVDGRDKRIGSGQAILALLVTTPPPSAGLEADAPLPAAAIYIDPRASIMLDAGDDLRGSAPEGADLGAADQELQGAAWLALRTRGVDTELAAALLTPTDDVWAVADPGSARLRLTMQRPPLDSAATPVVERAGALAGASVKIDATLAVQLGLAAGLARTPGDMLASMRIAAAPRALREVASGLERAGQRVEGMLRGIDLALERADRTLRDVPRSSAPDYESKREKAGRAAMATLDEAAAAIVEAEELLTDYPELLRSNPPSRTPVGEDPEWFRSAWRRLFQDKRDEYGRLAARAREFAGR
jgi:hypothetical protein